MGDHGMADATDARMPKYGIRVAAALTGSQAHTLRLWEDLGLIRPARTGGNVRLYSDADIRLIREIAELAARGINAAGVREILAMRRQAEVARVSAREEEGEASRGS